MRAVQDLAVLHTSLLLGATVRLVNVPISVSFAIANGTQSINMWVNETLTSESLICGRKCDTTS